MEKIERKQSVVSDQKERSFFAINSLGELLPIIFISFFFAYLLGSLPSTELSTQAEIKPRVESKEAIFAEKQNKVKKEEDKIYLNRSPVTIEAKTLPIIESKQKLQSVEEQKVIEEIKEFPRPLFPKTSPREVLPTLEVSQPIQKNIPSTEILSKIETASEAILVEKEGNKLYEKEVQALAEKHIKSLAYTEVLTTEIKISPLTISSNEKEEEEILDLVVETEKKPEIKQETKENFQADYNSSDFKWALNNYNSGIQKSAKFVNTPDGKASYCRTDAGIVLKINDLSNVDPSFGIFVEKSEDGEEYNSIGIINAENSKELYYFDAEQSFDGQHHYRFRSTDKVGEELEFGKVSIIRRASISPISSEVNVSGKYNLILNSKLAQTIKFKIKEAWGSLNGEQGTKQLSEGENNLAFNLTGDPGLYFLSLSNGDQLIELLIEKPGISPDLSFYEQEVSGKQSFIHPIPAFVNPPNKLSFDFYLKNGNSLIFNQGQYNSETVKIKKAKIGQLPESLQARHSEETLWFTASSDISYLHQKVPVILEHNKQEIAAQINIFASKNAIRPISHFSPDGDGIQDEWRIPGIESCPNTNLMVFNDWGNLIYKTNNVNEKNIWNGQREGKDLPSGMYYYVLGQYGGWVQLER